MGDLPTGVLPAEYQHEAGDFLRQYVLFDGEMDDEGAAGHRDGFGQQLDREILQFDVYGVPDLCEVLTGDRDPRLTILDEVIAATGYAREIVTEPGRQHIVAGRVHPNVIIEQFPDFLIARGVHESDSFPF
ncbi:hypothetical protein GMSM_24640 [Geomonas sp. Red276]